MRYLLLLFGFFSLASGLFAQGGLGFWKKIDKTDIPLQETAGLDVRPERYKTFHLDYASLKTALQKAPMEFTNGGAPLLVDFPQADGSMRTFRIWESPVMAPGLSAKYPEIRTYAGTAIDGSGQRIRLGVGTDGFHGFFFGAGGQVQSIRAYVEGTTDYYMAYRMEDLPRLAETLARCGVDDSFTNDTEKEDMSVLDRGGSAPGNLRKYRAAISAQGEYSQFHGGTTQSVLNAINIAINFITGITERDFGVRLELVPNNDTIIFLNPADDPYSGGLASDWFSQNPGVANSRIGSANYDIGHVFCRVVNPPGGIYTAGIASLGGVCTGLNKARAASSLPSPIGEGYYLIAAHEMGHQFSATHTFNNCPASQDARTGSTAFEPGGGSTIMGYTTCAPDNIGREAYYHIASIEQARLFITGANGATCGTEIDSGNNAPEVNIPLANGTYIPISTPFALTGTATDPDGDNLSYCWEQYDLGPIAQMGQPVGDEPLFRSFLPTNTPTRIFPRLQSIVTNSNSVTETLPDYARFMHFQLTVRDGKGGVDWKKVQLRTTTSAGPFRVTYPSGATANWSPGEYQIVTWDVANTDKAPVNCQKVNIKLSTSGGFAFPITLASGVPNTGRACIQVPDFVTTSARVMVEAADNIFFDISNSNFDIQQPTEAGFSFCPATLYDTVCLPATFTSVISTTALMGLTDPVTFSALNLPNGVTATFTPNPVIPGEETVMQLDFPANQSETSFDITLKGESGTLSREMTTQMTVYSNNFGNMVIQAPINGAIGQDPAPVLKWQGIPDANVYEIQVATNPSFAPGTLVVERDNNVQDSFKVQPLLEKGAVYYWRVRPKNECGAGPWVGPYVFSTLVDVCAAFESFDIPKNITGSATVTVESKINVLAGGIVSDVNIPSIQGNHEFFSDLEMHLISPKGTDVLLFKSKCPSYNGTFNFGFDDSKPGLFGCPPPKNGTSYKPVENLSKFNGEDAIGEWKLQVKDNFISSGGSIQFYNLELCSSTSLNPPVLVNNNPLQVPPGGNAGVTVDLLKAEDANNSDQELIYTLMSVPQNGELQLYWTGAMSVGAQFTQADLNNNGLGYFHYGPNTGPDEFCFTITDGEGGLVTDCFTIQPFPVSTQETSRKVNFMLAPNPATETVRISFGEALPSDTRIRMFDAAGRLVLSRAMAAGQVFMQIEIAGLPEGLYTVAVDNAAGSGVRKLVVR